MNRNYIIFSVVCLLLAGLFFGVGTYAYFSSNFTSRVVATIATWNFRVNGSNNNFSDISLNGTLDGGGSGIAPGSTGAFLLNIDGTNSTNTVDYTVHFTPTNVPPNMTFYSDSARTTPLNLSNDIVGSFEPRSQTIQQVYVYWKWPYGSDGSDTSYAGQNITIGISVTGEQA